MADNEIDLIIQNCTTLMCHIFSSESRLDDIIRRVNVLNGTLKHITEYQHCINSVNANIVAGNRRTALLGEFQLENKKILQYQEENRDLKGTVRQCMDTLALLMKKHRELGRRLANSEEMPSLEAVLQLANANYKYGEVKESSWKFVHGWLSLMGDAGVKTNGQDAVVAQLKMENNVLREMLSHANISNPGLVSKFTKLLAEMRQDDEPIETNSVDNSNTDVNITVLEMRQDNETDSDDSSDADLNITVIEMPKQ